MSKSFNGSQELSQWLALQIAKACQPTITTSGKNNNVPAGLRSVAISKTSPNTDSVFVTLSDGTVYEMTEPGEIFADAADEGRRLPDYIISGTGQWKWHGIK